MAAKKKALRFDQIGYWSEIKLDIIREYSAAYSRILSRQASPLFHVYVDAFSGAGQHLAKDTQQLVPGSPVNALLVEPPFRRYFLIDLDGAKVAHLQEQVARMGMAERVEVLHGDCNQLLLDHVFPKLHYKDFRRGLVVLDPYGLHLDWSVMKAAGQLATVDIFLNFPIMDMNRNALWRDPEGASEEGRHRMTAFWGDDSWTTIAYKKQRGLFEDITDKQDNDTVARAFQKRLQDVAGFAHVPAPLPMRNSKGAVVYYLFFASQKPVAAKIVRDIFHKYENRSG